MAWRRGDGPLPGLLLAALLPAACHAPAMPVLATFALAPAPGTLALHLRGPDRTLQYLRVADWDAAEARLTREGDATVGLVATAPAVAAADGRGRTATLAFPAVEAGGGYALDVTLRKAAADGTSRVVGRLEQHGLTLAPGPNAMAFDAPFEPRETPDVAPAVGLGPYVSTIPGIGVAASLSAAQDVLPAGNGDYYFLDNGRLGLLYRDANGNAAARTLAGVDRKGSAGLLDGVGTATVREAGHPSRLNHRVRTGGPVSQASIHPARPSRAPRCRALAPRRHLRLDCNGPGRHWIKIA